MSQSTQSDVRTAMTDDTAKPGIERWLKISMAAFVPLVLSFYLPDQWQPFLFVAGGLLVLAGIVALVRQERGTGTDASV
jgi:hypothetical protein